MDCSPPGPYVHELNSGSAGKESTCNVGDLGSIPGLGKSPGEGNGNPLQYSCLENRHGQRSLAGYSPWGHKESDMTERLILHFTCDLIDKRSFKKECLKVSKNYLVALDLLLVVLLSRFTNTSSCNLLASSSRWKWASEGKIWSQRAVWRLHGALDSDLELSSVHFRHGMSCVYDLSQLLFVKTSVQEAFLQGWFCWWIVC